MGTKSLLARENLKSCKSSGTKASTKSIWWATKLLTLATTVISDFEYVFSQLKRIKIFTTQFLFSLQPDFNLRSSLTGEWFQISHFYSIDKRKCDLFRSNKYKKQVLSLPRKNAKFGITDVSLLMQWRRTGIEPLTIRTNSKSFGSLKPRSPFFSIYKQHL